MILVTGATGFVGSHLIPRLTATGDKIRSLVRSLAKAEALKAQGVEVVQGDVTVPSSLEQAVKGVETVVHLVAILLESKGVTYDRINVQGTRNVVQAAAKAGVKRFIHMSVLGASPNPKYRYTYSKWQSEEVVRLSNLDFTILRPSVIIGEGCGLIDTLIKSLKMSPPFLAPIPGSGKVQLQPIWVGDVVTCTIQAIKEGGRSGQTHEIGGPEYLTYEQVLDTVMHILRMKRVKVHIPLLLMRPAVMVMERVLSNPPVTVGALQQLDLDSITDLDSVECHFNFKPRAFIHALDYIKPPGLLRL
jgi:NADH dehydrogenase